MKAVMFDIDGTLINSSYIDSRLYKEAIRDYYPGIKFKKNWSRYKNITDGGLLQEIFFDNNEELTNETKNKIKMNFIKKIKKYINTHSGFVSFPGAKDFISKLKNNKRCHITFATGGWKESAVLKLKSAGFIIDGIPIYSSDDSCIRTEIMQKALKSIKDDIKEVVYFGDATWDRKAAEKLGWNFIAVGKRLKGIEDYSLLEIN